MTGFELAKWLERGALSCVVLGLAYFGIQHRKMSKVFIVTVVATILLLGCGVVLVNSIRPS